MIKQDSISFNLLLNKLDIGAFRLSVGMKSRILFMNEFLRVRLGLSEDEMVQIPPETIFVNKRTYATLIKRVQSKGSIVKKEILLKAKTGREIKGVLSLFAVRSARGKVLFIDGIVDNFSFPGVDQKDLAASKELFKTVFNNSAVSIIVAGEDDRIIAWNPFAERILGMEREGLFNRPVCDLYPPEEWKHLRSLHVRKKGLISDIETKVLRHDGGILDVNLSISVIKDMEGKIVGSISIMSDVSSQKQTQKILLEAKKAAEAASEAKTMFLANMSHEVRTPMNTILGMVDLTLDTELNAEQRDNLLTVKNAADILLSLLNDILDLSRVEAGKIQLEDIEINIERIVRSVCKTMDILAYNKGLSLQWVIDESVPDMVKGDPVRIRQVLVNLINNAIKFTSKGKIHVEVKARPKNAQEICELLFSVKDEGIGIDKDKQEKIFDVFTQEDVSTTRQFGGTGLGLAICKKLLELMGGRIWVESEKGKGSTFSFVIPCPVVKSEDVPQALQEESIESQLMAQISRKKTPSQPDVKKEDLHILLAEDNLVNQKMAQRILEKKGWRVSVVNNGQEVLDVFEKQKFDLILMDAQMPVIDGLEATRRVRQMESSQGKRIPIIALTARAMSGDRKKCLDAGMDGYVSKPIDRAQLYETIESFFTT
jgi:PAS domain S-box-containing protein